MVSAVSLRAGGQPTVTHRHLPTYRRGCGVVTCQQDGEHARHRQLSAAVKSAARLASRPNRTLVLVGGSCAPPDPDRLTAPASQGPSGTTGHGGGVTEYPVEGRNPGPHSHHGRGRHLPTPYTMQHGHPLRPLPPHKRLRQVPRRRAARQSTRRRQMILN